MSASLDECFSPVPTPSRKCVWSSTNVHANGAVPRAVSDLRSTVSDALAKHALPVGEARVGHAFIPVHVRARNYCCRGRPPTTPHLQGTSSPLALYLSAKAATSLPKRLASTRAHMTAATPLLAASIG